MEERPKSCLRNCVGEGAGILTCEKPVIEINAQNKNGIRTFFMSVYLVKFKVSQNKSLLSGKEAGFACIAIGS
jgi:hypothetical protein